MQLRIITPERTVLEADAAEHVLLPAEGGELGILAGHIPMVCTLAVGRIRVDSDGSQVHLATSGGFAEVLEDEVTVLADTAERSEEIDVGRARAARDRARERLERRDTDLDVVRARIAFARAINRLNVAGAGEG